MEAEQLPGVKRAKAPCDCMSELGNGLEQVSFFPADGTGGVEEGSCGKTERGHLAWRPDGGGKWGCGRGLVVSRLFLQACKLGRDACNFIRQVCRFFRERAFSWEAGGGGGLVAGFPTGNAAGGWRISIPAFGSWEWWDVVSSPGRVFITFWRMRLRGRCPGWQQGGRGSGGRYASCHEVL